jgi:YVTN family beta-propeller protein
MRKLAPIGVWLVLCAVSSGQVLERTIHLGDTWRLPSDPVALVYDSRDRTVFIGGLDSDSILVLDEHTIEPLGWIDAGAPVPVLAYCPALNKLYCLHSGSVSVYDASTRARLKAFPAAIEPTEVCLDSEDKKLYVVSRDSATVTVVDCNTDSVVAVLRGLETDWDCRQSICYVPGWHRVYCCDYEDSAVVAIDCRTDSVLTRIRTPSWPTTLCFNEANGRVYLLTDRRGPVGIDVGSSQVVSNVDCLWGYQLFCNPREDKLYGWCGYGDIGVFDCVADNLVATVPMYGEADVLTYSPTANKVYGAGQYS